MQKDILDQVLNKIRELAEFDARDTSDLCPRSPIVEFLDSLVVVQLVVELEQSYGVGIPEPLFQPEVEGATPKITALQLAAYIEEQLTGRAAS